VAGFGAGVVAFTAVAVFVAADSTAEASAVVAPLFMAVDTGWVEGVPSMPGRTFPIHLPGRVSGEDAPTPSTIGTSSVAHDSVRPAPSPHAI
jgi:hypothetical protein